MLSVVVTTHHEDAVCYLTVASVVAQLEKSSMNHEIIVVADGGTELKWEKSNVRCIRGMFGSPQASRDTGIKAATFPDVLVLESHVVVSDIVALLLDHQRLSSTITFPIRVAEGPEMFNVYAHETDWEGSLWHKRLVYKQPFTVPYRTSQFGNSCFIVNRDWYRINGGYTDLMKGWGGEEPFICLKCWMLGGQIWQVPTIWHAHWLTAGAHADTTDRDRNLKILRFLITGELRSLAPTPEMFEERKRICAGPFKGDVNKLREYFKREGVVN